MSIQRQFCLSEEHRAAFARDGFVKLAGFVDVPLVEHLRSRITEQMEELSADQRNFDRMGYDIFEDDQELRSLLAHPAFADVIAGLAGRDVFYTQGLGFQIARDKHHGFPWHIGTQSFGYQRVQDYGCSLWMPLHPIDPEGQGGGMSCVSKSIVSGRFMYEEVDPAIDAMLASVERWDQQQGNETKSLDIEQFAALRHGVLNDAAMDQLLDFHKQTDAFELGDALMFDKHVLHVSEPLGEGPLDSRAAFVMRFVDIEARYDHARAQALEFPRRYFGHAPKSEFHLNVCRHDGEKIADSTYFVGDHPRVLRAPSAP